MPITLNGSTGAVTGLAALPDSAMASGSIIQVVQAVKTDGATVSVTQGSIVDLAGAGVSGLSPQMAVSLSLIHI